MIFVQSAYSSLFLHLSPNDEGSVGLIRNDKLHHLEKEEETPLYPGDLILSKNRSLKISSSGNGIVYLAPETEVYYLYTREDQIHFLSLIKGEILFTRLSDLDPLSENTPSIVLNFRDLPHGLHGDNYQLKYAEKSGLNLNIIRPPLQVLDLPREIFELPTLRF